MKLISRNIKLVPKNTYSFCAKLALFGFIAKANLLKCCNFESTCRYNIIL